MVLTVELLFLGTGAADWDMIPKAEMKHDMGKNIRRTSCVLINSHILIDPAPASFEYAEILGVELEKITDIFITHTHSDHYNSAALNGFCNNAKNKINLWYEKKAQNRIDFNDKINPCPVEEFGEYSGEGFKVVPLTANHIVENSIEQPLHYYFEIGGKKLFYGCDGAWLLSRTCEFLINRRLDCAVFDATVGDYNGDFRLGTHNSIPMIRLIRAFMEKNNAVTENPVYIMSHLARTLHTSIEQTRTAMSKEGYIVAYDSMKINI